MSEEEKVDNLEDLEKQVKIKPLRDHLGRLLPGQTANPNGRPIGKSLKIYEREKFIKMTDEEKEQFLKTISPELRYRMAEGNPKEEKEISGNLTIHQLLDEAEND